MSVISVSLMTLFLLEDPDLELELSKHRWLRRQRKFQLNPLYTDWVKDWNRGKIPCKFVPRIPVGSSVCKTKLNWQELEDLLFCDIEDPVADVVCRCLPVSVDEAAAPAILTHWDNNTRKTWSHNSSHHLLQVRSRPWSRNIGYWIWRRNNMFASSPTCQRLLGLRQVEDLVKSSSLGAVVSSSVFVPADTQRSCST